MMFVVIRHAQCYQFCAEEMFKKTKIEVLRRAMDLFGEDPDGRHNFSTLMGKFRFHYAEAVGEYEGGLIRDLTQDRYQKAKDRRQLTPPPPSLAGKKAGPRPPRRGPLPRGARDVRTRNVEGGHAPTRNGWSILRRCPPMWT